MTTQQPATRPANPRFSSGPCAKPPTHTLAALNDAPLGRSHRAAVGKAKLLAAIEETREILGIPADYKIGIVPASDTGAFEMAMWSLLGERPAQMVAWESFGAGWVTDVVKQLKIEHSVHTADYGEIVDMSALNYDNDVCFTWNGTTSGVRMANGDAIPADRDGLTLCDATSAAFAMDLPWDKLDVAKSFGRRSGPRHADPFPTCSCASGKLHTSMANAKNLPPDQRWKIDRRYF
jgi:phosphoserine aminotransferase